MTKVRIFCEVCEEDTPLFIEPLQSDDLNGDKIWGDIVCSVCHFVIATISADEPGEYEIVRKVDK